MSPAAEPEAVGASWKIRELQAAGAAKGLQGGLIATTGNTADAADVFVPQTNYQLVGAIPGSMTYTSANLGVS